jgi:hypothetical protein
MNTDAQRRAAAAFHAKREAEGLKKVTLWLSPSARLKLDAMKVAVGSKDKAAEAAILAWGGSNPVVNKMAAVRQIVEGAAIVPSKSSAVHVDAPLLVRKAFNPQPKKGKP